MYQHTSYAERDVPTNTNLQSSVYDHIHILPFTCMSSFTHLYWCTALSSVNLIQVKRPSLKCVRSLNFQFRVCARVCICVRISVQYRSVWSNIGNKYRHQWRRIIYFMWRLYSSPTMCDEFHLHRRHGGDAV